MSTNSVSCIVIHFRSRVHPYIEKKEKNLDAHARTVGSTTLCSDVHLTVDGHILPNEHSDLRLESEIVTAYIIRFVRIAHLLALCFGHRGREL